METTNIMTIEWSREAGVVRTYQFFCQDKYRKGVHADDRNSTQGFFKEVFRGRFLENAPDGLEPDVEYFLKRIHALPTDYSIENTVVTHYPQSRERYELLDLKGPNIRKPKIINADALAVRKDLEDRFDCDENRNCYIVEQPYSELYADKELETLTVYERLEYLDQICLALKQLYKNTVNGHGIDAHRDVKISNCLILRQTGIFTVVLTDFASIHFSGVKEAPAGIAVPTAEAATHGLGTAPYPMSRENTAPESLDTNFEHGTATDVYALGNILAALFGYIDDQNRTPNLTFCEFQGWGIDSTSINQEQLCRAFQAWYEKDKELGTSFTGTSWLEEALRARRRPFHWGDHNDSQYAPDEEFLTTVRRLFFESTRIDPGMRISLEDFHEAIRTLKKKVPHSRSGSLKLYRKSEAVFLLGRSGLQLNRKNLCSAVQQALEKKNSSLPVYAAWYQKPTENSENDACYADGTLFEQSDKLLNMIRSHDLSAQAKQVNLTEMLYCLYLKYHSEEYWSWFRGVIRIFTCGSITGDDFPPIIVNGQTYRCTDVLGLLRSLSEDSLTVVLHCPEQPTLPKSFGFRWVELPNAGTAKKAEAAKKDEAPKETYPPLDQLYITGAEGLFFQDGNRKFLVSRKKIRRE